MRRGFTLIELTVIVLILGLLAAIAIPQYLKSVETTNAEDASMEIVALARANQLYAADHNNTYVNGMLTNACNSSACTNTSNACELVACRYIAAQDWDSKPYSYYVGGPSGAVPIGQNVSCSQPCCAQRNFFIHYSKMSMDWSYSFDLKTGQVIPGGTNPPPPASGG